MARIGVVFSSGFFGFFAHAGFLAGFRDLGLVSSGWAGASSGAILAAMAASGMSNSDIKALLYKIKKKDFWDPDPWYWILLKGIIGFKGYDGYLRGVRFRNLLNKIPIKRIEDGVSPLAITATNLTRKKETVFTQGDLVKAVWASGAVPLLFKPVRIDGEMYVDGGLVDKAPIKPLADLIKPDKIMVHFIVSDNMDPSLEASQIRNMKPWDIYRLSVNIARHDAYQQQCSMLKQRGIEIIEVITGAPSVGPNRLELGPKAYDKAREETKRILSGHPF
jgi:NTE family protein